VYPFARASDGTLVVTLYEGHIVLLRMVLTEVRGLLDSPAPNAGVSDRLFPRAYLDPTEDTAEAEFQGLVHHDLARAKVAAFDDVLGLLGAAETQADGTYSLRLDEEQEDHLLAALNDLRLVLAELLEPATGGGDRDEDDSEEGPAAAELLDWLTALESELIEVKLGDFPGD
jgi:hypothetical protein